MARALAMARDLLQENSAADASSNFQQQRSRTAAVAKGLTRFDSRSGPGSDASLAGVDARPDRGMKFREPGLDASRTRDSKHTPARAILHNASANANASASASANANPNPYNFNFTSDSNANDQDIRGYEADEDDDFDTAAHSNSVWSPSIAYSTPQTSIISYSHPGSVVDGPSSPSIPLSPRWDSLGYDRAASLDPTSPTLSSHPSRSSNATDELYPGLTSAPGPRDDSPSISTKKLNTTETVRVDNFSRPRKPSIRQPYNDPTRFRPTHQIPAAPAHLDASSQPQSQTRHRDPSVSSDMSAAALASAPVRPPDMYSRDNARSRGRQPTHAAHRPPVSYRAESSGPTYTREPLPRMASVPNDELRSSYRSQLSASTGQGTAATERSSVATKSSSVTSVYGAVDDNFSIDDVMGMYEKGFYDDSAAEENDSRPATAISEQRRRRTTVLEAMNSLLPMSEPSTVPAAGPIVRESAAIFNEPNIRDSVPMKIPEEAPGEASQGATESSQADHRDGHNGIEADDESDDEDDVLPPPSRQPTDMTSAEDDRSDRDRYGFRKSNQYVSQEQYDRWNQGYTAYLARRRRKWNALLREHGLMTDNPNRFPPRSNKTKRFVRKGIPPDWRGAAWFYYAGGPAVVAKHPGMYDNLLKQKAKEIDAEAIERDLHRTFPDNVRFRSSQSPTASDEGRQQEAEGGGSGKASEKRMISSLRRVLHAFSIYNPRIGYCQSLNFLAGLLLLFVETEEHAFWLLNIITRVYLPGTHEMSLEGANVDLGVLMASLRESMPNVWAKIGGELDGTDAVWPLRWKHKHAPEPTQLPPITLCMTAWFMSCFIGTLPIESVLRVWDVFFYEGSKTLFRIALAIFKIGESEIKAVGDPMEIFQVVQTIPRRLVDANALMEACFKRRNGFGHLSQETVEQKRQERRNQVKAEREKMTRKTDNVGPGMDAKKKGALFSRHK
ncbi:RabGAP/TBC [Hypoxylon sp. FL1284]|nr:RabGAP/TBC [Hypoxylon sp. FL1284]